MSRPVDALPRGSAPLRALPGPASAPGTRARQRGLTFGGFVFVAAVVVVVVMLGLRITPAVVEYYSVKQALQEALETARDPTAMPDIQKAFQRRIDAGYIESVTSKDVELRKEGNTVVASVAWSRTLHLVANASLLLEFEAVATR